MRWCKYLLALVVASSSLCLSSDTLELSLLPFYTRADNLFSPSRSYFGRITGEPGKLFFWFSGIPSGCLPVPEDSKNVLVIIDDDRPGHHQVTMLLPVNKEELISTFVLDDDTDVGIIPPPCDQDACIARDYKGHVSVLDLSETVPEPVTFETKAGRAREVIRTMGQYGDIIYQWYDQDGHLHTLSEWEFQRRLSMCFQSLLECLYPEFFDSALPAGGGWYRWQYRNVRKASDRPEKSDQSLWRVQGRGRGQQWHSQRRQEETKPVAVVKPVRAGHTGPQPNRQQRHHYRRNEPFSVDEKGSIDTLLTEFEAGGLQRRASQFGQKYDGIKHSCFCNGIKKLTQARKAPLDNEEKHRFEPFMKHLSKVVYSFNGKSLSICVHSLTVSELLDPHSHHSVRMSQQQLSEELLDAIKLQARRPREQASLDAQGVSNHLWSLAKLVARKALTPKQASPAVTALLPQVKNHQADFIPQHVANLLWALAKLVEREVFTPDQASPAVTALLPQVQHHQAEFTPQHVASQLWALAKLVEREVITQDQASPALTALLPQVQSHQAKFNPQAIANQLWALAKLVERKVITPKQASPAVMALLPLMQKHQAEFTPQHVTNQLWALAKLVEREVLTAEQASTAVTALLSLVQKHQADFIPQHVANQLWALAKLVELEVFTAEQASPAVTTLLPQVQNHQARFTPQEIANQLWALAKLVEPEVLTAEQASPAVTALLPQVQYHQAEFKPQEIANQLWALAVLGDWVMPDTISNILGMLDIDAFESLQSQEMALWALTVFLVRGLDQAAVKPSMMKLYRTLKDEEKKDSSEKRITTLRLSGVWLEENIQDLLIPDYKSVVTKSQTKQRSILAKIFPNRTLETEASVYGLPPVDLLFSREKVVVEIQGPHHYLDKEKQIRTGSTILKTTTYQKLGYKVIEVHASDVANPEIQEELRKELSIHFSKTEDGPVHNACDSSDDDTAEEDKERFSAEDQY